VQRGENLYRIALRYGTSVDAIVAANRLPNANLIQAGQLLLVPVRPPTGTAAYVIQPGDTLYSIARRFGKTVETLAALNGIAAPYTIRAGQTLVIAP
jgi:LysM repeat protein